MKVITGYIIAIVVLLTGMTSCSDSQWDQLPDKVSEFITAYYPNQTISNQTWENSSTYVVTMRSGEVITFDKSLRWTEVNGHGGLVPQLFLFDELPPALYEYLQATENLSEVFSVRRNSNDYVVELLNQSVIYDIETGAITVPVNGSELMSLLTHSVG